MAPMGSRDDVIGARRPGPDRGDEIMGQMARRYGIGAIRVDPSTGMAAGLAPSEERS
ncbi:MAG: hypothetical protein AAGE03_12995 [Pseudomonadota bacterium]